MKHCTSTLKFTGLFALALLGACSSTSTKTSSAASSGAQSPAGEEQMALPKATPEHSMVQQLVGNWDATVTMTMPGQAPMVSSGSAVYRAIGETWVQSDFRGEMMGMPFVGHGVDGYDTLKKKYVGTWVDTLSTEILVTEGTHDASTHSTTMAAVGHDPATGKELHYRMISQMHDNDTFTFHMNMKGDDGKYFEMMKIDYKRRTDATTTKVLFNNF